MEILRPKYVHQATSAIGTLAVESLVNALDQPLQWRERSPGNPFGQVILPESDIAVGLRQEQTHKREAFLGLASNEKGLAMDRIHAYRRSMGAPNKALRVLDVAQFREVGGGSAEDFIVGTYFPTIDVAMVMRDEKMEAEYGPGITEARIIHELGHSSSNFPFAYIETVQELPKNGTVNLAALNPARVGFEVDSPGGTRRGSFLEEGYVQFERGRYVTQELGLPEGFLKNKPIKGPMFKRLHKHMEPIINHSGEEIAVSLGYAEYGAATLEALVDHDPPLLNALREARHSVEGLREVAQRINAVMPGLYRDMMAVVDTEEGDEQARSIYIRVARWYNKA